MFILTLRNCSIILVIAFNYEHFYNNIFYFLIITDIYLAMIDKHNYKRQLVTPI